MRDFAASAERPPRLSWVVVRVWWGVGRAAGERLHGVGTWRTESYTVGGEGGGDGGDAEPDRF